MSLSKSRKKVGRPRKNKIDTLETRMLEIENKIDLICEWIESKYGNVLPSSRDVPSRTVYTKTLNLTRVLLPCVRVTKLPNSSVTLLSKPNSSPFNVSEYPKKGWTTLVTNSNYSPVSEINTLTAQDITYGVLPKTIDLVTELPQIVYVDNTYAEPQRLNYDSSSNDTLEPRIVDYEDEGESLEFDNEMKIEVDYPSLSSPNHIQSQEFILPSGGKNGKKRSPMPKCKTLPPSKSNVSSKGRIGISNRSQLPKQPKLHNGDLTSTKRRRIRRVVECDICGKSVTTGNLSAHKDTHSVEGKYMCVTCGKRFRLIQSLNTHTSVHLGIKTICSVCGIQLSKQHLTRHMRHVHEEVRRPYPCTECAHAFKNRYALKRHLKLHQNPKYRKRGLKKDRESFSRKTPPKKIDEMPEYESESATVLVSNLTLESIPGVQPEPRDDVNFCVVQYESKDTPAYETSLPPSTNCTTFSSQDWYNPTMPDEMITIIHHAE